MRQVSGSPMLATDTSGNVVWKENYRPYGEKLNKQPASSGNKIGFHGNHLMTGRGCRSWVPGTTTR